MLVTGLFPIVILLGRKCGATSALGFTYSLRLSFRTIAAPVPLFDTFA
jgi:hypothetical protein